jgi:hypothetical protein
MNLKAFVTFSWRDWENHVKPLYPYRDLNRAPVECMSRFAASPDSKVDFHSSI